MEVKLILSGTCIPWMVLMPRGFVNSWNLKFGPCDLCGMPCVGAKGLGLLREDEGCGPREGLAE